MFVGKYWWASGANAGDRYEGDWKDGIQSGNGNKSPSTPIPPTTTPPHPQSNKMFIIIIIIAVCGGFPFVVLYS